MDETVFCDTGVEFPEMYEHIRKVEKDIERPITVLKSQYTSEYLMFDDAKTKGKNKGKRGWSWPDVRVRWCSDVLKGRVWLQHMKIYKRIEVIEYHGIALDEAHRADKNNDGRNIKYPLIEGQMTEKQALEYCYSKGFDWNG